MKGWTAIYYREILILRKRFFRQLASMSVMPLLYMIAFGYGIGESVTVDGVTYMNFMIPGLLAMNSMVQGFGIAAEINIARFYWRVFEEFQAAPIRHIAYVTGEVLFGITRAVMGALIIIILSWLFGVRFSYNGYFWLALILNAFLFASLAVCLAMVVKSHADQALLVNFVITPMGFLGGTFFPLERMPLIIKEVLSYLPITHAAIAIRQALFGYGPALFSYGVLLVLGIICFVIAVWCVDRARE
ncbi:MAG: ABC transporter permease [Syntrophobacterales bacterium]|nr:ABC transporter permease [Syntrophobacterales bacterium]